MVIPVHNPGSLGGQSVVDIENVHFGIDWNQNQLMLLPKSPLSRLTQDEIDAINESVKKGQSWHAYQSYKKIKVELDEAKLRIKHLERELQSKSQ